MENQSCRNCRFVDATLNLCRRETPTYKLNDWTGQGAWPKIKFTDWCGQWKGDENALATPESPAISSTISCPVCGLSWTAHEGSSWVTVIEAKKGHECIPLSPVNFYSLSV